MGAVIGFIYASLKYLERNQIGWKEVKSHIMDYASKGNLTFKLISNQAIKYLIYVFIIMCSIAYWFVKRIWVVYLSITVPVICVYVSLSSGKADELENASGILSSALIYFEKHIEVLLYIVNEENAERLILFGIVVFFGMLGSPSEIIGNLEKDYVAFKDSLKQIYSGKVKNDPEG